MPIKTLLSFLYPKRPEMRYMSFQTAMKIVQLNTQYGEGRKIPIENIEETFHHRKQEIQRLQGEIQRVDQNRSRLEQAEDYLRDYEKHQAIVEKYEHNPFLRGKMLFSKSIKQEYEDAVAARDRSQYYMEKEGVSGRVDFEKQVDQLDKMEARVPEWKSQIESLEKGLGLLDAVLKGLEQATVEMTRERKRQQQQPTKRKRKSKQRYKSMELER
ncbi:hypothetical protein [Bacillus sp. FJAT-47783]|uniref:hypothetical protein n=1 Tax=Bacillus sp. FJAT-47783 TaxID=2922712 RepID=UPI001FACA0BF|nr:hypothetical protein [Bacillus sp. FJAT-47783]